MLSTFRNNVRIFVSARVLALVLTCTAVASAVKLYCVSLAYQIADDLRGLVGYASALAGCPDTAVASVALVAAKQFVLRIQRRLHHKEQAPYLWGSSPV